MTMKSPFLILILFVFGFNCQAMLAEPADSTKKFSVSEAFILGGASGQLNPTSSIDNFRRLCPNSPIINQSFQGYNPHFEGTYGGNGYVTLGIGLRKKQVENSPTFRVAISYATGTSINGGYDSTNYSIIDTITSTKTGQKNYIYASTTESYRFRHVSNHLRLELSSIWRSTSKHKMKLYGGIGLSGGFSLNSQTTISWSKYPGYYSYSYYGSYNRPYPSYSSRNLEIVPNKMQTYISIFCPFGIDYQLSKKSSFWKTLNLFLEFRAQVGYTHIPEIKTIPQGFMQTGFGFRKAI